MMIAFSNRNGGAGEGGQCYAIARKQQVFPVMTTQAADYYELPNQIISQRLVDAVHVNDLQLSSELLNEYYPSGVLDVNFIGTVCLKSRKAEVVLNGESASEVRFDFEEFRTDVTALFLAAQNGNLALVRKLLKAGANVNQKLFRGYATTGAVREGHMEVLELVVNACGAAQSTCEEALLEACYLGRVRAAELLMDSDMIRPHVAAHALVTASGRGYVDFINTLIKRGVDADANARILLQSSKPSLHANVDCNALFAAIVNRQISVVQLLLMVGCKTDTKVRLGAWSWDVNTGEEFRVGAGLAEPYSPTWCAVEYFEESGVILRMLLEHHSPNIPHLGRTILHHAILCRNAKAVKVLLNCGADVELPVVTTKPTDFRAIHLASQLGLPTILGLLINAGCNLNSRTGFGETALMICARQKHRECLELLAAAGADFGLSNMSGQCAKDIARSVRWTLGFQQAVLNVLRSGKVARSSNSEQFSTLLYATRANDVDALKEVIKQPDVDLNEKDESGFSAVMIAAAGGHVEAFRLLVTSGADLETHNKFGETARSLAEANQNSDAFSKILTKYDASYAKKDNNISRSAAESDSMDLHTAAHLGKVDLVRELIQEGGQEVNALDSDGYTPLMLAARSGHAHMCEILISCGAKLDMKNARHETALSLSRKGGGENDAEGVILDEIARRIVTKGELVKKHTRAGKGNPHVKTLKIVETTGVLCWGKSRRRNVICRMAETGPSSAFRWNRRKRSDADDEGVFRVVTTHNREIHFSCLCGGSEMASLWVRGIRLVTREAIFGRNLAPRSRVL